MAKQIYFEHLQHWLVLRVSVRDDPPDLWHSCIRGQRTSPSRSVLTRKPTWSFAGNLKSLAMEVMRFVSQTTTWHGTKDHLNFVYIDYPPHHGKSLLFDNLFIDDPTVCVLNATYKSGIPFKAEELRSPEGAISPARNRFSF